MRIDGPIDWLQIELPAEDKQSFKKTCWHHDTTMARLIRKFITEYNADPESVVYALAQLRRDRLKG